MEAKNDPAKEKGLMDRRKSFSQDTVPNAHKGTDHKAQYVMLAVFAIIVIASYVLAKLSV